MPHLRRRPQSQLFLPHLPCSRTEPCLNSVHLPLPLTLTHMKTQPKAPPWRMREAGKGTGGRKPPDHTTKTWTQAYSFKPLAKQCSIARYTTSGQTVVNRSALHMASAGSLKKHNLFQTRSKTDTKACNRL